MGQHRNVTTLEGIEITERIEKDRGIVFEAKWDPGEEAYDVCPKDGCEDPGLIRRGEYEDRKVRDMRSSGQPVAIRLDLKRYQCKECGGRFRARHEGIVDQKQMTRALYDHLQEASLQWRNTFSELEDRFGLGKDTVRVLFDEQIEELDEDYSPEPPRVLGIDGVYVDTKGETWTLLVNLEEKTVIELVEAHEADPVSDKIRDLGLRGETEAVVMDMSSVYEPAIESALPRASIVVDRWHIVAKAEKAMDTVKSEVADKELMDEWRGRKGDLNGAEEPQEGHQLLLGGAQQPITLHPDEDLLDRMEAAYRAKNEFERIFELRDRERAARRFREWERQLPKSIEDAFECVTRPLKNWRPQILNYFDHPYTNSAVENLNKIVGEIDDRTDGCEFSTMRGKLIFGPNHRTEEQGRGGLLHYEGIGMGNAELPLPAQRQLGGSTRTVDYGAPFEEILDSMEE